MGQDRLRVFTGAAGPDEATELATAHALVRHAGAGEISEAIHIYRPMAPAVVFGRRDTRLPGYPAAARAATEAGFQIAVRAAGGRAVAYTQKSIVIDHVRHEPNATSSMEDRFILYGELLAGTLRTLGVDARVGAVPGEYCPGAHSVNARGVAKLIGTAQRVVRDAWLFSTLITLDDHLLLRPVLDEVYGQLGLAFDPVSVGSVRDEVPGVSVADVEAALFQAYGLDPLSAKPVDPATAAAALGFVEQHRL